MDAMLTPNKIAADLHIRPATVRGWINTGQLPAINTASPLASKPRYRVALSDLEAFLQSLKRTQHAPVTAPRSKRLPTGRRYV